MPSVYKPPTPLSPEVRGAIAVFNVNLLRANIVRDLSMRPEGDTTGNVAKRLEVDYRQVYAHFRALMKEGLVTADPSGSESNGRRVIYRISPEKLQEMASIYIKFLVGE